MNTAILWPMIAHAALVFAIYFLLGVRRKAAVQSGGASPARFRDNRDEPAESLLARNNLANQFELPVLFHAVCLALYATAGANWIAVTLAWIFVATRYIHAFVHVTSNDLRLRSPAFAAGFIVLALMWGWLALHLA